MKFGMILALAALLLNGCGNTVDSSDHVDRREERIEKNNSDARGFDLSKATFYTFGVCLSKIKTLHDIFGAGAPKYEFEYRCFYAREQGMRAASRKLNEQISETACPTRFEVIERAGVGFGNLKLKATPTQRPQIYISTNVKNSYDEQLAKSKCAGGIGSFTEEKSSLGDPAWTNVEIID